VKPSPLLLTLLVVCVTLSIPHAAVAQDLYENPESIPFDYGNNRYLVSNWEDGSIVQIDSSGAVSYFYEGGLNRPLGMTIVGRTLFVACLTSVVSFDLTTDELISTVQIAPSGNLNDVAADSSGYLYITNFPGGRVYRMDIGDQSFETIATGLNNPNGVLFDQAGDRVIVCEFAPNGNIWSIDPDSLTITFVTATGINDLDGIAIDNEGYFYISSWATNAIHRFDPTFPENEPPDLISTGHVGPADIYFNRRDRVLAVPNFLSDSVVFIECVPDGNYRIEAIALADDDDDQILEPGETVEIVVGLSNTYYAHDVVASLATDDQDIDIEDGTADFGDIAIHNVAENSADPFVITLSSGFEPRQATLSLTLTTENGDEDVVGFELFLGLGDVLLVDDDEGDGHESFYLESLEALDLIAHRRDVALLGSPNTSLLQCFSTVLWFTGGASENTLSTDDQANVGGFLDSGGNLFLTGQNIAEDIGTTDFFSDYLHSTYHGNWTGTRWLEGVEGDPIGDGLTVQINAGASNQTSPDIIEPLTNAYKVLNYYSTPDGGAIRFEENYRLVYFGFGLEAVPSATGESIGRADLMTLVLDYLGIPLGIEEEPPTGLAISEFHLGDSHPNPWHTNMPGSGEITINFSLPEAARSSVSVYDINGKLVKTLAQERRRNAGQHTIDWDGLDEGGQSVSSGLYFYRLETNLLCDTKRVVLIK